MSAIGTKRTSQRDGLMSGFGVRADILRIGSALVEKEAEALI
jgi:hypothetical protein